MRRLLIALVLTLNTIALPTAAAERLRVRIGPFARSIATSDLEAFAKTGQIPTSLQPYAAFLRPSVQQILSKRLLVNPTLADRTIDNWLGSPTGKQIFETLTAVVPDTSIEQLRVALRQTLRQVKGIDAIALLKAYPQESITINAPEAIALALQFNSSHLQSRILEPTLKRDLAAVTGSFVPPFNPASPGPHRVRRYPLMLRDPQRKMPDGIKGDRSIPTDIYWAPPSQPSQSQSTPTAPLVVISHGFGADRFYLAYLAVHLASHGFIVAAIEHPGSNMSWLLDPAIRRHQAISPTEFIDRPLDVSFLLDELEKINQQPGPLRGQLNTQQASIIGHSLGGYTGLVLAGARIELSQLQQFCRDRHPIGRSPADWLQCAAADLPKSLPPLRDPRVVQVIALNPVIGRLFGKTGLRQVQIPTLFLSSTKDAIAPATDHQLRPFKQLGGQKYLLTAIGSKHLSISNRGLIQSISYLHGLPYDSKSRSKTSLTKLGNSPRSQTPINNHQPEGLNSLETRESQLRSEYDIQEPQVEHLQQLLKGVTLAFIKQLTPDSKTYQPFLTPEYAQSLSTRELPLRLNRSLPESLSDWVEVAILLRWLRLT